MHPTIIRDYSESLAYKLFETFIAGKNHSDEMTSFFTRFSAHLHEAIVFKSKRLMEDYITWSRSLLAYRGVSDREFAKILSQIKKTILDSTHTKIDKELVKELLILDHNSEQEAFEVKSYIDRTETFGALAGQYLDYLLTGDRAQALVFVKNLVRDKVSIKDIYLHIFQTVLAETGRLWFENRIPVITEHFITSVTQTAMNQLFVHIIQTERVGRNVLALCVGEEQHDIGIRMVSDFFEIAGWDTYYIGANAPASSLLSSLDSIEPDLVAISVTGTEYFSRLQYLLEKLNSSSALRKTKTIVGGSAFNRLPEMVSKLDINYYAQDPEEAVFLCQQLKNESE
jgi:methanogenic corrinoid protein MtbC1